MNYINEGEWFHIRKNTILKCVFEKLLVHPLDTKFPKACQQLTSIEKRRPIKRLGLHRPIYTKVFFLNHEYLYCQ